MVMQSRSPCSRPANCFTSVPRSLAAEAEDFFSIANRVLGRGASCSRNCRSTSSSGSFRHFSTSKVELNGDILNQSPNTQAINLPLTLVGGSQTIDTAAGNVVIAGGIGQSGGGFGITKTGSGTLVLSGVNTYSGGTTVNQGTLIVTDASALPTGTSLVVGAGGILVFDPSQAATTDSAVAIAAAAPAISVAPVANSGQAMPAAEDVSMATMALTALAASPVSAPIVASPAVVVTPASGDAALPGSLPENNLAATVASINSATTVSGSAGTAFTMVQSQSAVQVIPAVLGPMLPHDRGQSRTTVTIPRAHDAALQSLNAPAAAAGAEAAALWDWDSSWSSGRSDRKHGSSNSAVDEVMAMFGTTPT